MRGSQTSAASRLHQTVLQVRILESISNQSRLHSCTTIRHFPSEDPSTVRNQSHQCTPIRQSKNAEMSPRSHFPLLWSLN